MTKPNICWQKKLRFTKKKYKRSIVLLRRKEGLTRNYGHRFVGRTETKIDNRKKKIDNLNRFFNFLLTLLTIRMFVIKNTSFGLKYWHVFGYLKAIMTYRINIHRCHLHNVISGQLAIFIQVSCYLHILEMVPKVDAGVCLWINDVWRVCLEWLLPQV